MVTPFLRFYLLVVVSSFLLTGAARADAHDPDVFFGTYDGVGVIEGEAAEEGGRKLRVEVKPDEDEGFIVDWTTVITKDDGRLKSVSYSIHFQETEKDAVYSSAMRKNMFGRWVPLNPIKGDPYVWARIQGRTMTVYALIIREDGGYEMQQYERTVTADGAMQLVFKRFRDGDPLKTIYGTLERVGD